MPASDLFGLSGKVALVTGATRGNGRAIAELLASVGAHVVVTSRSDREARGVATKLGRTHDVPTLGVGCDVADRHAVKELFQKIRRFSRRRLGTVVNNAGYALLPEWWDRPIHKFRASELEHAFRSVAAADLEGSRWCTYYALPTMLKQGSGTFVYTSSTPALTGYRGTPYTEAKAAVLGFMRDVAREYGPRGVRANAVAPGNIRTAWLDKISAAARRRLEKENPLQRFGEPDEIAKAVLFLASDLSSFVTGETLIVDGGTVMR